jgi:hypothetical protein
MYVEAFHRVLKYVYLKGKVNRRVDMCVHVLLKVARDKAFDRLIKIEKGKTTSRINIIHQRHKESLKLALSLVNTLSDTEWLVQSFSTSGLLYSHNSASEMSCELFLKV